MEKVGQNSSGENTSLNNSGNHNHSVRNWKNNRNARKLSLVITISWLLRKNVGNPILTCILRLV